MSDDLIRELQASRDRQIDLRSRLVELEQLESTGLQHIQACQTEMKRREEEFMKLQVEENARKRIAIAEFQKRMEMERTSLIEILSQSKFPGFTPG